MTIQLEQRYSDRNARTGSTKGASRVPPSPAAEFLSKPRTQVLRPEGAGM